MELIEDNLNLLWSRKNVMNCVQSAFKVRDLLPVWPVPTPAPVAVGILRSVQDPGMNTVAEWWMSFWLKKALSTLHRKIANFLLLNSQFRSDLSSCQTYLSLFHFALIPQFATFTSLDMCHLPSLPKRTKRRVEYELFDLWQQIKEKLGPFGCGI